MTLPLLSSLLPRPLDLKTGDETATVLQSLVTRIHLDRPLARQLGWRGVKPSATNSPAWTFRTANADGVYGLLFEGERVDGNRLTGFFSFFFFPDERHPAIDGFSPDVHAMMARKDYETLVRDLSAHAPDLLDFAFGVFTLSMTLDRDALALSFESTAAETVFDSQGSVYSRQKLLRLLQPGFALLAESARAVIISSSKTVWSSRKTPALRVVNGELEEDFHRTEWRVIETIAFGTLCEELSGHVLPNVPLRHQPTRREGRRPIVHVVSGFLGSGKTTFIASWLNFLHGRERFTGVLQNEFGEIDLDSLVLSGETKVESLDDGCVCCSLADSLRPGLFRLMKETPAEQFILETTGVASPSYVMASLQLLDEIVTPGLLITLVDALDLANHPEKLTEAGCRRDQIEAADVIVLTKTDRVSPQEVTSLRRLVSRLNRHAALYVASFGSIPFGEIDRLFLADVGDGHGDVLPTVLTGGVFFGAARAMSALPQRKLDASNQGFVSHSVKLTHAIPIQKLVKAFEEMPPELLRAKGIVRIVKEDGEEEDRILQWAAGQLRFEPTDEKTAAAPERYIVLIGRTPLPSNLEKLLS